MEKRRKMIPIMKRFGVKKASVFGSFAEGRQKNGSDIDLLVDFEPGRSLLDLSGLKLELESLFGREVDIVTRRAIHPLLRKAILSRQEAIM